MSKDIFLFFISPPQTLFVRRGDGKQRELIYQHPASFIFCKEPAGEARERRQRSRLCLRSSQSPSAIFSSPLHKLCLREEEKENKES